MAHDETEYRSFPLNTDTISPAGLPAPYGSAQDVRHGDITQLHSLPVDVATDDDTADDIQAEYLDVRPPSETPRFTPVKQLFGFSTVVSVDANIDLPFKAQSVRLDNLTSQWVFVQQLRRWVPPFWYGAVYQITGLSSITFLFQPPPGITQPAVVANGVLIGTAHTDYVPEVDGEAMSFAGGTGALASQVQGAVANGANITTINPLFIGASDGVNSQDLRVESAANHNLRTALYGGANLAQVILAGDNQGLNFALVVNAIQQVNNGTNLSMLRTPTIFRTVTGVTAAGNTAAWTPVGGKKFRLMRFRIDVTAQAILAVAGNVEITFQDSATAMNIGTSIFLPAAAAANPFGAYSTPWIDLGNGFLSAVANNVLNVNLSVALTGGELRVQMCGTEE